MIQTDKDIVAELHDVIQSAIGSDRYEVWFRGQVTFKFANDTGTLDIHLPDEFSLEQVRRRFSATIQDAFARISASPIQLQWKASPHVKSSPSDVRTKTTSPAGGELSSVRTSNELGMRHAQIMPTGPAGNPESHSDLAQCSDLPGNRSVSQDHRNGRDGHSTLGIHGQLNHACADTDDSLVVASANQDESRERMARVASPTEIESAVRAPIQSTQPTSPTHSASRRSPIQTRSEQRRGEFGTFIGGTHSALALSAAKHTVQHLGEISPLFLYGPTGVGKTHLLQSIYGEVRRRSRARCVLLSAEQFTSSFLEALRGHGLPSFRRKYRHIDLLLLDDIQFFVGKRATLVELLYTLDALVQDGHQVVLAADRPPNELSGVGNEIIARLSAGLICGLEYPEGDAKIQLVQRLAQERGLPLAPEVAALLADELPGDARRIKGAVNRLSVIARAMGEPPSVDRARRELADLFQANQRPLAIPDIERAVCEVFGVDGKLLRSDRKTKTVSQPRMLAMWLARKHTRAAFSEIGDYFGGRSHSTVISAHHKVERWVGSNSDIQVASGESKVCDAIKRIELNLRAM